MAAERWSRSDGGVCNNCGEPEFTHVAGRCPGDLRVAELADAIERWHQRVDPIKDIKDRLRKYVRSMRGWHKKGWCKHSHLDRAEQLYRLAAAQYEAMIQLADEQADESHPSP